MIEIEILVKTIQLLNITYNIIKKLKDAESLHTTRQCLDTINKVNDKLDMIAESFGESVKRNFRVAKISFEDFSAAEQLTTENIQIIKLFYLSNIGLPLNGKTGKYENNSIIAYSYVGLIALEKETTNNIQLISRFIQRVFEADLAIAEKYFPEIYKEYYEPIIISYNEMETQVIIRYNHSSYPELENNPDKVVSELCDLINLYDVTLIINDWKVYAGSLSEKTLGALLNKIIGKVTITSHTISSIYKIINKGNNKLLLWYATSIIGKMVYMDVRKKRDLQYYKKKRHQMIASFTAREFLSELSEGERIL